MVKLFRKNSNLCDHNPPTLQTDRQTDRQTTCDRNIALCTKVHRAVKTVGYSDTSRTGWCMRPTLAIACSPLDAGQTDVMIDRHHIPIEDFRDKWRTPLINFSRPY